MFFEGFFPYTVNEYSQSLSGNYLDGIKQVLDRCKHSIKYILFNKYPPLPEHNRCSCLPHKNYVYFQEFMPGNTHDIRVTVIGNRAFGYIRHNRPDDFRASGSGCFDTNPANIPLETVRIAHQISQRNGFQSMAYDFLRHTDGSYLVNEISYCFVSWMVHDCPGYWDRDLKWHSGYIWPEEAHVDDFVYYLRNGVKP